MPFSQQLSETTEEVVRSLGFVNFDRMELTAKLKSLQESNVVKVLSQTEPNPMAVNAKVVLMLANISTFIHDLNEHSEASFHTLTNTQQVDENETKALLLNQFENSSRSLFFN